MTIGPEVPVNLFENERELMVVAPMPGVAPEDISVEVTSDGRLILLAEPRGEGQDRITHLRREWSYGPYQRTIELPYPVDAMRANVAYGNGVLSITLPRAEALVAGRLIVPRTGHARGIAAGHAGTRGGEGES
jgi:HSP20 family protein